MERRIKVTDHLMELGNKFEAKARRTELYACVWIDGKGPGAIVHVNNPPADCGIKPGEYMSAEEFTQKANAYLSK